MTEKHYDSDWAKEKSRVLTRDMLRETVFGYKRPDKVRVLHFGGRNLAEAKGYIALGINPKNIISVEREAEFAAEQKALGLGVDVRHIDLEDFVEEEKEINFDLVSLDYTGPVLQSQNDLLKKICERQKASSFLLHTANLIRRDHKSNILYDIAHSNNSSAELGEREKEIADQFSSFLPGSLVETAVRHVSVVDRLQNGESIKDIKPTSYARIISLGYSSYVNNNEDIQRTFEFITGRDRDRVAANLASEASKIFSDVKIEPHNITHFACTSPVTMEFYSIFLKRFLEQKLADVGLDKQSVIQGLHFLMPQMITGKRTFYALKTQGYHYTSESGSPMVGNLAFLRKPYRFNLGLDELKRGITVNGHFEITDPFKFKRTYERVTDDYLREVVNPREASGQIAVKTPVVFLGDSSKKILSKKRFLRELKSGKTVETIKAEYRGWENKPLAAWQAHANMGTYDSRDKVLESQSSKSGLEALTKEDAIELLSVGFTPAEINSQYPSSFSVGSLRAIKAHMTMNTYTGVVGK